MIQAPGGPSAAPLRFDVIHNFRDYGGYQARSGRLVDGRLFRSGQHQGASAADLETVARLGLVAVVDLRGPAERAEAPCPRPPGFAAEVIVVESDNRELAPHLQAGLAGMTAETARTAMLANYARMPFRTRMLPVLERYFALLAERKAPVLIHCMAGKDRTGLAVALLHHALGVRRDDLMADYLLTNTAWPREARMAVGGAQLRRHWGHALPDAAVEVIMSVEPDYLHTAFKAIEAEHGSVDAYLEARLGLTAERRAALEARLLV